MSQNRGATGLPLHDGVPLKNPNTPVATRIQIGIGGEAAGWFAHLGGFPAGAILIPVMRHSYDPVPARAEAQGIGCLR